jgi:hypothetical protein
LSAQGLLTDGCPLFYCHGPVAQWLAQGTHNLLVVGSNPTGPTNG